MWDTAPQLLSSTGNVITSSSFCILHLREARNERGVGTVQSGIGRCQLGAPLREHAYLLDIFVVDVSDVELLSGVQMITSQLMVKSADTWTLLASVTVQRSTVVPTKPPVCEAVLKPQDGPFVAVLKPPPALLLTMLQL